MVGTLGRSLSRWTVALCVMALVMGAWSETIFSDGFEDGMFWTYSAHEKYKGEFKIGEGKKVVLEGDLGLIIPEKALHYGVSRSVYIDPSKYDELVIQYEVKYESSVSCSGAYIKMFDANLEDLADFRDSVPYSIMFGPDKCGSSDRVHFIYQYKDQNNGEIVEHHLQRQPAIGGADTKTHLYTLILRGEEFEIMIDRESKRTGSISSNEDFTPPLNPPEEINDPDDRKPSDWVDDRMMDDPNDSKPEDWDESQPKMIEDPDASMPDGWLVDEPLTIPDPSAVKPEEWDDEEDGIWMAEEIENPKCTVGCGPWTPPKIKNPKYVGKWTPKQVPNPNYIGEWKPRRIKNPGHYVVENPRLLPFGGIGLELWVMDSNIRFDNFYIGTSAEEAEAFAQKTWALKRTIEDEEQKKNEPIADSTIDKVVAYLATLDNGVEQTLRKYKLGAVADSISEYNTPYLFALLFLILAFFPIFGAWIYFLSKLFKSRRMRTPVEDTPTDADVAQTKKNDTETKDDEPTATESADVSEIVDGTETNSLRQRKPATATTTD